MVKSTFISKSPDEVSVLSDFLLENDQSLFAQSFLSFEKVKFTVSEEFAIVFFNSPRSAHFFLEDNLSKSTAIFFWKTDQPTDRPTSQGIEAPSRSLKITYLACRYDNLSCTSNF